MSVVLCAIFDSLPHISLSLMTEYTREWVHAGMDLDSAIKELHSLSSSSPKKTVRFAPDVERYFTLTPTHWKDGVRESDLKVRFVFVFEKFKGAMKKHFS